MTLIVTGGYLPLSFLQRQVSFFTQKYGRASDWCIIAADRGAEACMALDLIPDHVVGDFDSLDPACKDRLAKWQEQGMQILTLPAEKDDTDTEAALHLALEQSEGEIVLLGGTGHRLDHVLGNVSLLCQGLQAGRSMQIVDPHNRIRMTDSELVIQREEQYGSYVSLFPCGGPAKVTLEGFAYPLTHFLLEGNTSLGVSNEIVADVAKIRAEEGRLLVIESKD